MAEIDDGESYEYYGFVTYLISFLLYCVYIAWAYLPDQVLHSFGITYYVSRYWGLAIPVYVLVCILMLLTVIVWIIAYNPSLDDLRSIVDSHQQLLSIDYQKPNSRLSRSETTKSSIQDFIYEEQVVEWQMQELKDIPMKLVNQCMRFEEIYDDYQQFNSKDLSE